jgi:hypothetical protein
MTVRLRKTVIIAGSIAGVLVILLMFLKLSLPHHTFYYRELSNTGHTPLFGMITLLLMVMLRQWGWFQRQWWGYKYLLTVSVASILAIGVELVQYFGPRDADFIDLLRGVAGAVSVMAVYWSYDQEAWRGFPTRGRSVRLLARFSGVLLFIGMFVPLALWFGAYQQRAAVFPRICGFESYFETKFVKSRNASVRIVALPEGWEVAEGKRVAKISFRPAEYPGVSIWEPFPDWRGYKSFSFKIYSELPDTIGLVLRINDAAHDQSYYDRFNRSIRVAPGSNEYLFAVDEIRHAPRGREMDLTRMTGITLFAVRLPDTLTFFLDDIRLVK